MKTLISVEGNIGAGKSTLLEMIRKMFPESFVVVPEPIHEWTKPVHAKGSKSVLQMFYDDPVKNAFRFQVQVVSTKVRDLHAKITAAMAYYAPLAVVCERDPYDVEIFPRLNEEMGYFDADDTRFIQDLVQTMKLTTSVPQVVATIYLRASPELCMERILKRNRKEETADGGTLTADTIARLHELHESRFTAGDRVLVLDAAKPVMEHEEAIKRFVHKIMP